MKSLVHRSLVILLVFSNASFLYASRIPRVTVIFVIDQFAYHELQKVKEHLRHGLHHLIHHGIIYENAYFPYATPCTAPGHAGLNTGAYPNYHGIIANNWFDAKGNKIHADDDTRPESAVFAPDGTTYPYGKSGHFIMADGLTDQFLLSQAPCQQRFAYSLSFKSRAATMSAGQMGKAVWFDNKTGNFTSSKAYFDALPEWIKKFNETAWHKSLTSINWKLKYPAKSCAYGYEDVDSYAYSSRTDFIAGTTFKISSQPDTAPFDLFLRSPAANQLLLELAEECITEHVHYHNNEQLLLWVCLSPLDAVGHEYGPQSREVLDMIYHLDKQIECFMKEITKPLKRRDFLFVVTADHGISFIPEMIREKGYNGSKRVGHFDLMDRLNNSLKKDFEVNKEVVIACQSNQLYLDMDYFNTFDAKKQKNIIRSLKHQLQATNSFKHVWTGDELAASCPEPNSYEAFFKYQYLKGRSGQLIVQPWPNQPFIEYPHGATHRTPYEPDTHVPLILYQKSYHEKRVVFDKVWTLQLANTLAHILHIPQPSASPFPLLPGIIEYDPITGEAVQPVVL